MSVPELTPIESSSITGVGYIDAESTLFIRFVSNKVYAYLDLPSEVYRALISAESKGRFFNRKIRDTYQHLEVEADEG